MMVQYGPVGIGDSSFTCPTRSLSMTSLNTKIKAVREYISSDANAPTEWLNETLFTGYHRFAATTRILTDAEATH